EIFGDFLLRIAPGEVGIRLREAELREAMHDARPREGFRQENDFWISPFYFCNGPLPESERLGMRVVDAEDLHAVPDPELEDALQLLAERVEFRRVEVERIDVLVLLRRVLGVLHAAVGPPAEPARMLLDVGVVGRALEGDVEGEIDSQRFCLFYKKLKV